MGEALHERAAFCEDVDIAARAAGRAGIRKVELAVDILNAERREARRDGGVRKGADQPEASIVDVDFVVGIVGREQGIARRLAGDGQAGVDRALAGHADQSGIRIETRPSPGWCRPEWQTETRKPRYRS